MIAHHEWLVLLGFVAVVAAVAVVGSLSSLKAADVYEDLQGPSWAPPSWLFGPVWTVLYVLIAVSGWLVWRTGAGFQSPALVMFGVQLLLNGLWSPAFFALEWRGVALAVIMALDIAVAVTIFLFWQYSRAAAVLLLPYLGWVLFATALNYAYWTLNLAPT